MSPVISIVTPSLNQGEFIGETIRSVVSQAGDFFIDYIIVDGGSTDNSLEIIKKYETLLKESGIPLRCGGIRYRWFSEKDKGQSDAINKGLCKAEGAVAAWLNADDYYADGTLATAARHFAGDPSLVLLYGGGFTVDRGGRKTGAYNVEPVFDLWKLIHLYDFILQPSVFMRLDALKGTGMLDEELEYIMDWELWIRLSRFGRVRFTSEPLSFARVHSAAKTQSAGMKRWNEIRKCSMKYGHLRVPPVLLTQIFHRPLTAVTGGNSGKGGLAFSMMVPFLRKIYYRLIGGNTSGIHPDGSAESVAYLSVPFPEDAAELVISVSPVRPNTVRYFINNRFAGTFTVDDKPLDVKISVEDPPGFLHLKFVSNETAGHGRDGGRAAFRISGILMKKKNGEPAGATGLPQFITT